MLACHFVVFKKIFKHLHKCNLQEKIVAYEIDITFFFLYSCIACIKKITVLLTACFHEKLIYNFHQFFNQSIWQYNGSMELLEKDREFFFRESMWWAAQNR